MAEATNVGGSRVDSSPSKPMANADMDTRMKVLELACHLPADPSVVIAAAEKIMMFLDPEAAARAKAEADKLADQAAEAHADASKKVHDAAVLQRHADQAKP